MNDDNNNDENEHQKRFIDGLIAVITTHCEQQTMSSQEIIGCLEYVKLIFWRTAMRIIDEANDDEQDN